MDRDSITRTGARAPGVERWIRSHGGAPQRIISDTEQGITDGSQEHEGRRQTSLLGRPRLTVRPWSRTGENPPYGNLGEAMETSASSAARSAPLPYPTAENDRPNCLIQFHLHVQTVWAGYFGLSGKVLSAH